MSGTTTIDTSTAAVTALLDGVTPGPWSIRGGANSHCFELRVRSGSGEDIAFSDGHDASFIADSRDLVPALAAERDAAVARAERADARVAELEAKVERLRKQSCATCGGVMYWGDECCPECSPEAAAEKDQKLFSAGWTAAIEAAADILERRGDLGNWSKEEARRSAQALRSIPMPADATAVIDRLTAQARAQGMRDASGGKG